MEIVLANSSFERIGVLDNASVIWDDKYFESGEYELYLPITEETLDLLSQSYYVIRDDNQNNVGVVQDIELTYESESGDFIKVTGRFASGYILGKRVIAQQTLLYGAIPTMIRTLVDENVINPTDTNRKIDDVILGSSISTTRETLSMQVTGDNLLEKVSAMCKSYGIGFKMTLSNEKLNFDLYQGEDRSYAQSVNPYVVFSDEYDNLNEVTYSKTTSEVVNYAYVAGEGEGASRKIVGAFLDEEPTGIDRNEVWVDQRNMSSNDGEITDEELTEQMKEEGLENLVPFTETFDGTLLNTLGYEYNVDFFLGDIVTVKMKKWNGLLVNARIVEAIESEDSNGKLYTFTFEI